VEQLPEFTKEVTDGAVIMFTGLVDAMFEISGKLREKMQEVLNTLLTAITEHGPYIFETGFEVLMNLINGILENLPQIMKAAQKILNKLISGINKHMPEIIKGGLEILTALLRGIADNFGMILQTAFDILDELVKDLTKDDTLEKLIDAAIDIVNSLLKFMFDNLPTVLEEWIPDIMDSIAKAFMDKEEEKKLDEAGNYLGGILAKAIKSGIVAIFKSGEKIGMRALLNMLGFEGDTADMVMNVMDIVNKHQGEVANDAFMIEQGITPQPSASTQATSSSSPKKNEVTSDNVGLFADGSYGPVINFYSPVINNKADAERVAEQAAQLQTVANSSGGRY
jgi:hypothetical protein